MTARCESGCPNCGTKPRSPGGVWRDHWPFWRWVCENENCPRFEAEQRNQTAKTECPWCGSDRKLVAHEGEPCLAT